MISIEISLLHTTYMEEGATLSRTLLPYINRVTDFRFLTEETHFIASRFLGREAALQHLAARHADADNVVGPDPAAGEVKRLKVNYTFDGVAGVITKAESSTFSFPADLVKPVGATVTPGSSAREAWRV